MLLNPFFDFDQVSLSKSYQANRKGAQIVGGADEEEKSDYSSESGMSSSSEKEMEENKQ